MFLGTVFDLEVPQHGMHRVAAEACPEQVFTLISYYARVGTTGIPTRTGITK